ncbi:unnamed protein product [Sympodiomycopsis kandeliae]
MAHKYDRLYDEKHPDSSPQNGDYDEEARSTVLARQVRLPPAFDYLFKVCFLFAIIFVAFNFYNDSYLQGKKHGQDSLDKPDSSPFGWHACPGSQDKRWKCGSIKVPYDYHNKSDTRTMQIETVLFQTGPERANHTIVVNPGGPGGSGVSFAWSSAEKISSNYTDNQFDVLGFDPRGVNASIPHVSCYPNYGYSDRTAALGSFYREKGDKRSDLELYDALYEAQMKACREKYGDLPGYLTTALVARDMDLIRSALQEDQLYYYGVSYGTGLGTTYNQMYPDRVGRMLLDGLENIRDGRTTTGFGSAALYDIVRAFNDGFIGECIRSGPKGCALASKPHTNETDSISGLHSRMQTIFDKLIQRPISATHPTLGPGLIRYKDLISVLYSALYNAATWPDLASAISSYELHGNATKLLEKVEYATFASDPEKCPIPENKVSGDSGIMTICGDSYDAPHPALDTYLDIWEKMENRSFIGGDGRFLDILPCRHFDWTPAEVYRGDLNATLSTPILLISETYDPATPLHNGKRLFEEMTSKNARLLIHHGYGHSSRDKSTCTEKIKRRYFLEGKLPQEDVSECYADTKPYPIDKGHKVDLKQLAPTRFGVKVLGD